MICSIDGARTTSISTLRALYRTTQIYKSSLKIAALHSIICLSPKIINQSKKPLCAKLSPTPIANSSSWRVTCKFLAMIFALIMQGRHTRTHTTENAYSRARHRKPRFGRRNQPFHRTPHLFAGPAHGYSLTPPLITCFLPPRA